MLLSVGAGDIIQLGDYSWQVLDVQNGRALVLSEIGRASCRERV